MRSAVVSASLALLSVLHIDVAVAQASDPVSMDGETVEEIIVTGSRILRRDFFSVSPIVTLDRAEIGVTGTTEIKTLLNDLPQVDAGVGGGTGNGFLGSARVNLRALGDLRTLNLLNGRRFPQSEIFGTVDLNSIPPAIIERVEVITGGASAVYGSDALAGAVNFILRNDFDGLETSVQYDVTERGDGETFNFDLAWGTPFADGRGNIALFGNFYDRSTLFEIDRSFSATPLTTDDDTGEIVSDASFISPSGAIDGDPGVDLYTFDSSGVPRLFVDPDDRFNTAGQTALQAPMERYSANAFGHYDVSENFRTMFEFNYSRSKPVQKRSDVFASFVDVNVDRPDIAPELSTLLASDYDPDGDGVASFRLLRRFNVEQGQAVRINERDFYRGLIGFEGDIGGGWAWTADYSYGTTELDMRVVNDNSRSRIRQGLLVDPVSGDCFDTSGGCVPVNPFGAGNLSRAAADFIRLDDTGQREEVTEQVLNATFRGPLLDFPAGDVDTAFGVEYRRQDFDFLPSQSIQTGDSLFVGFDLPFSGNISVREAYAEARVPLFEESPWSEYVGLELGVRWSDYDTLDDDVWTWKAGAEWQLTEGVRFRAMRQRAIRAPNAAELFQSTFSAGFFFSLGPLLDQCSASRDPVGSGLTDLCVAQGIPASEIGVFEANFFPTEILFSSNQNLDAEEADSLTAGVVWQPVAAAGLSLSVDYYDIEIDNAVGFVPPDQAVRLCFITRDPNDQFCNTFSRGPTGDITTVLATFVNAAVGRASGIDIAVDYAWDTDGLGLNDGGASWGFSLVASHYLEAGVQASPLAPFLDCAGSFGALCDQFIFFGALPEWRANTRLTYESGRLLTTLRWQWIDGMTNSENEIRAIENRPPAMLVVPELSSASYFDLTLQYDFNDWLEFGLGIVNMFDRQPPFLGSAADSANTDPRTYDTLGRRYFLRLTARL